MNPSPEAAAPEHTFISWEAPGKPLSVRFRSDVIDAIHADMMRGFTALRVRGAEVGGILLGSIEHDGRALVRIEGHVPVECEYAFGPSWRLSSNDETRLTETISNSPLQQVVGFYRSHTRMDLSPDEFDLALFAKHFTDPASVILLIKPFLSRPGIAGFFFRENGEIHSEHSYLEFPFQHGRTTAAAPPPQPETAPPVSAGNLFANMAPHRGRGWIPFAVAAALAVAAGAAFLGVSGWRPGAEIPRVEARPAAPEPAAPESYDLGLTASESANEVVVEWNRRMPAVVQALRGVLEIHDGTYSDRLDLDGDRLRGGKIVYSRIGRHVAFHLEVFTSPQRSITESLDFVASAPEPPPAAVPVSAPRRFRRLPRPVAVSNPRQPAAQSVSAVPAEAEPEITRPAPRR